jgi:cation:H+ antiporter
MEDILSLIFFVFGIGALIKGADFLLQGASSLAVRYNVPQIVIGLSVVSIGTSLPELFVSLIGSLNGQGDIVFGNIVGSSIFNILIILGVASILSNIYVRKKTAWLEIPSLFFISIVVLALSFSNILSYAGSDGGLGRGAGIVLLSCFGMFLYYLYRQIGQPSEPITPEIKLMSMRDSGLLVLIGVIALGLGSHLVIEQGTSLARILGVSESLIALSLISIGTGLPELVTTLVAGLKKEHGMAIGNVVGSNIINLSAVLGLAALISPITISNGQFVDVLFLYVVSVLLFIAIFVKTKYQLSKVEGLIFIFSYFIYMIYLVYRG